jgi:serine/threonine-protein kinase
MVVKASDLLGGKYRILRCIGVGGMGSVYEAVHEGLGTRVAVKVLLSQLAQVPTLADRFLREARVSASIDSPHVIRATDVARGPDGIPYLVMELLEGESLQKRLDDAGHLELNEALDIADQILAGLEHAHALGVVHRDLKPDNAYLVQQGGERVVSCSTSASPRCGRRASTRR